MQLGNKFHLSSSTPSQNSSLGVPPQGQKCNLRPSVIQTQIIKVSQCRTKMVSNAELGEAMHEGYDEVPPNKGDNRRAGVILHITSLPGKYGCGEMGEQCYRFMDWLTDAGMQCWQILPLVPPDDFYSPYSSSDSNCGNPLLIGIEGLIKDGLLDDKDRPNPIRSNGHCQFNKVKELKTHLLTKAATRANSNPETRTQIQHWVEKHPWVNDSALFSVISQLPQHVDKAWWDWDEPLRYRDHGALSGVWEEHRSKLENFIAIQWLFDKQWQEVRQGAMDRGIQIIGDMPIYVGAHSADVWAHRHLYELKDNCEPRAISGVPPDAFSKTGQLWGSPLYAWGAHRNEGYEWWCNRMRRAKELYDEVRIDHFRAFTGYWSVDYGQETAMIGAWRQGPGLELFHAIRDRVGDIPVIAENLGIITPDVEELRKQINAPGMVVLQFAWGGGARNTHLSHRYDPNQVVYPGTHDNETTLGWWRDSATHDDKDTCMTYLSTNGKDIGWVFINECCKSVARTAIMPMQDVMRLSNDARMNSPGKAEGNWTWQIADWNQWDRLKHEAKDLYKLNRVTDRLPESLL